MRTFLGFGYLRLREFYSKIRFQTYRKHSLYNYKEGPANIYGDIVAVYCNY